MALYLPSAEDRSLCGDSDWTTYLRRKTSQFISRLEIKPPLRKMMCTDIGIAYANAALFNSEIAANSMTWSTYGVRGTRRSRSVGWGTGERRTTTKRGRNTRVMMKNWAKVIRFPERGWYVVNCSRVRALLRSSAVREEMTEGRKGTAYLQQPPNMRARIDTHSDKTVRVTPLKMSDVRLLIAVVVPATSPKVSKQ